MKKEDLVFSTKSNITEIELALEWLSLIPVDGKNERNLNRAIGHLENLKKNLEHTLKELGDNNNKSNQL